MSELQTTQQNRGVRFYGMDNLKTFACLSVVIGHLLIPYVESFRGRFWFSPSLPNETMPFLIFYPVLFFVNVVAMSLFLTISGNFVPSSYDKQGFSLFMKKKVMRLLLPTLFSYLFFNFLFPVPLYHFWFLEILFVFCLFYALIRRYTSFRIKEKGSLSPILLIAISVLVGVATIFLRYKFPTGYVCRYYIFYLEVGKIISYVVAFVLGVIAYRKGWFFPVPKRNFWIISAVAIAILVVYIVTGVRDDVAYLDSRKYTLVECSLGILVTFALIWAVNLYANKSNRLTSFLSENSMGIYLFHLPILCLVQRFTASWEIYFPLKFVGISFVVILLSVVISYLVRKIPYVNKCI